MTNIVVACLITWSGWTISPHQAWFKARSVAQCQQIAQSKKFGLISYWKVYDLDKPRDVADYFVQCGPEGKDCLEAK